MGCYPNIISITPKPIKDELVERRKEEDKGWRSMVLGVSLVLSVVRRNGWKMMTMGRRRRRRKMRMRGDEVGDKEEKNKSWLLAKDDDDGEGEEGVLFPSVHSSFRFSLAEAEAEAEAETEGTGGGPTAEAAGTTVLLLVNLEGEGGEEEGERERQKWRRLDSLERSISPVVGMLVRFSYQQIRGTTRDFARGRELGRGAHSRVYKGRIGVGPRSAVAIKRVVGQDRESSKAFCRELMIASSLHHPNVVPLLGFCVDQAGLFLVYKYVSGGSLDHHLHPQGFSDKRRKVLPWEVRYKVAMGVAQAIGYLHYGTDKCVVHRDIKPSNILLSSKKSPKLCDFGLATWTHGPSLPFLCKAVKGTFGYLAPEYFQHGKLSDKTDVYAFGVVLLELITGRKAIDRSRPPGDENLVLWSKATRVINASMPWAILAGMLEYLHNHLAWGKAKPLLEQGERAMEKLADPKLKPGSYPWGEMSWMVRAAAACIGTEELTRPSIDKVIEMLQAEDEFSCSTDWSIFTGSNNCLLATPFGSQLNDQSPEGRDIMRGHLALAMLGVSDSD